MKTMAIQAPKKIKGYLGNPNIKRAGEVIEYSQDEIDEYARCMLDPIYFITKYIKITTLDYGIQPFILFDYQTKFIKCLHENRKVIGLFPRQHGKTTCVAAYLVWYTIFNDSKNVAILANKRSAAQEVMSRMQEMYSDLPKWIQPGVKEWNKGSYILANGSKAFIAATTAAGIRGKSVNFLYIDEAAIIPNTVAEAFFAATYPTISSGETTKIALTSTPLGLNHFWKFWIEAENGINGFIPVRVDYWEHPLHDDAWAAEQKKNLGEVKYNQEIGLNFLGSSFTLIAGEKIAAIPHIKGNIIFPNYVEYEPPRKDERGKLIGSYVMTVDTSRGADLDSSAFVVFDISQMPYKVVAKFKDAKVNTLLYPEIIMKVASRYNDAFVLIETNDLGQQVADILFYDLEYENVYMSYKEKIKEGQSNGTAKSPGLRTTKRSKAIGCDQLKTLIEADHLIVNDVDIISEMSTFVRVGTSYKAEDGKHDDLIMCLVMFGYLTQEAVFKELFDFSLRKRFIQSQMQEFDDQITPIGFVDRGTSEDTTDPLLTPDVIWEHVGEYGMG